MVDVALLHVNFHGIDDLLIAWGAESGDSESLCLSASEESGAMCSWEYADLARDGSESQ